VTRTEGHITKADIEAKFAELGQDVGREVEGARSTAVTVGIAVAVVVVVGAFLLGRRRGKRLATIVEIRRV
jgi:hypothetical protein